MIRKTTLMAGIAGAMLMAVPALAQDAMSPAPTTPQDPAATTPMTPEPAAPSGTLQLQPGANVKGSDGSTLGQLEAARSNAAGEQELVVRGADGQLRGVPLAGLTQQGADVAVAWTAAEFQAAPAITPDPAAATPPASAPTSPSTPPTSDDDATTADPTAPDGSSDMSTPSPTEPQA